MKARPMPMSAPMVRAILAGTKTQTRRVVKPQFVADAMPVEMPATDPAGGWVVPGHSGTWWCEAAANPDDARRCPYGQPGDRLWVREAFRFPQSLDHLSPIEIGEKALAVGYPKPWCPIQFEADGLRRTPQEWRDFVTPPQANEAGRLRAGMHMPRWASRITLEVTGVRVERVQDISVADAIAEGVNIHPDHHSKPPESIYSPVQAYRDLWESINGPESWEANPWVWVVEFKRLEVQQ